MQNSNVQIDNKKMNLECPEFRFYCAEDRRNARHLDVSDFQYSRKYCLNTDVRPNLLKRIHDIYNNIYNAAELVNGHSSLVMFRWFERLQDKNNWFQNFTINFTCDISGFHFTAWSSTFDCFQLLLNYHQYLWQRSMTVLLSIDNNRSLRIKSYRVDFYKCAQYASCCMYQWLLLSSISLRWANVIRRKTKIVRVPYVTATFNEKNKFETVKVKRGVKRIESK